MHVVACMCVVREREIERKTEELKREIEREELKSEREREISMEFNNFISSIYTYKC